MKSGTLPHFFSNAKGIVFDRDRPIPVADISRDGARLAGALRGLGVREGDRVGVWLPNVPAWLAMLAACGRLGAILVAVNTRFKSAEVADIVGRSRCRALMFWPGFRKIDFTAILAACDPGALRSVEAFIAYSEAWDSPAGMLGKPVERYADLLAHSPWDGDDSRPDAGCIIFTTSGTTKLPKFVLHDQQTVIRHAHNAAEKFGYMDPDAKILVAAPFCGAYGFCTATAAMAANRPLFSYPASDTAQAARAVRRHAITHTNATDEFIAQMLAAVADDPAFPSARFFGYVSFSPAHLDLPRRAEQRGLKLVGLYGSSELQALIARQSEDAPISERVLAGGALVAGEGRVRTRDPETDAVLPHGVAGELEFEVPSRMAGYFDNESATKAALTNDGWYRSGDLGYTHPGGKFVFLARQGDAMRLSGFLVSPAEIEAMLQRHEQVAAAQVVGVETPRGMRPFAFVILRPGALFDEQVLLAHCAANMAGFKLPLGIHPLQAFPVAESANATKIQKSRLREMATDILTKRRTS